MPPTRLTCNINTRSLKDVEGIPSPAERCSSHDEYMGRHLVTRVAPKELTAGALAVRDARRLPSFQRSIE
jgi:hypothetical protein